VATLTFVAFDVGTTEAVAIAVAAEPPLAAIDSLTGIVLTLGVDADLSVGTAEVVTIIAYAGATGAHGSFGTCSSDTEVDAASVTRVAPLAFGAIVLEAPVGDTKIIDTLRADRTWKLSFAAGQRAFALDAGRGVFGTECVTALFVHEPVAVVVFAVTHLWSGADRADADHFAADTGEVPGPTLAQRDPTLVASDPLVGVRVTVVVDAIANLFGWSDETSTDHLTHIANIVAPLALPFVAEARVLVADLT